MSEIILYTASDNKTQIDVQFENETVWLNRDQIATLFGRDIKTIGKHVNNVFKDEELDKKSVVAKFATTARDGKIYQVDFYNLDVIISVGYRVKSKQGTQFRQWATQRLKEYLVKGYALNEKRLKELDYKYSDLQKAIKLASNAGNIESLSSNEAKGILKVIEEYAYALETLDKYDHQILTIETSESDAAIQKLTYDEAIHQIRVWRDFQKAGNLFGNEKDQSFRSSLETIYQTFDDTDLYPSFEEKAANLLYFIVKKPFVFRWKQTYSSRIVC